MAIEFYSFGTPHPAGVEEHFKKELPLFMKNVNTAKVLFIHNPRISNMLMTDIDLLLIMAIENKKGNFHKIKNKNIYNAVIPINFINETICYGGSSKIFSHYKKNNKYEYNAGALIEGSFINEQEYSYMEILKDLGWQSKKYLEKILGYKKINTHPIVWSITNDEGDYHFGEANILKASKFGFRELIAYFYYHPDQDTSLKSVNEWYMNFDKVTEDFKKISTCYEQDSYIGSLTRKKIDRLSREFHNDIKIYEKYLSDDRLTSSEGGFILDGDAKILRKQTLPKRIEAEKSLDKNIVIINGKAGSGKTFELYLLMKKLYENKKQIRFLTYNQMLRNDAQLVSNSIRKTNPNSNQITVRTIQQLTYKMAKALGILTAMSAERLKELLENLQKNESEIMNFWQENYKSENIGIAYSDIKFTKLNLKSNKLLRLFLTQYNSKNNKEYIFIKNFSDEFKKFIKDQEDKIRKIVEKELFLSDYFGILKIIYASFFLDQENSQEAQDFWRYFDSIEDSDWKFFIKNKSKDYKNNREDKKELINRSLGGFKRYIAIIDEGQDFHELERDILLKMSDNKSIVVATGGKEQLIRFDKECRWDITQNKKIPYIQINKRNTSFRMKENIVNLCNFIANKFKIDLDLKSENYKDKGRVIISTKKSDEKLRSLYHQLHDEGEKNGYSYHENILFLLDTQSEHYLKRISGHHTYIIDEYDNVRKNKHQFNKLLLDKILKIDQKNIWLHNISFMHDDEDINKDIEEYDDEKSSFPNPNQYRIIYYESCRGLEAWAVMCFDIDIFYDRKKEEEAAALFCSDDMVMTEEERRSKYAATQVLMALTRAIDTLYIEIHNPNSELGKIIMEYVDKHDEIRIDRHIQESDFSNDHFDDDDIPF